MYLPKLPPCELSTAPAGGGFFAASSRNSSSIPSRVEGAAQKRFRLLSEQADLLDVPVSAASGESLKTRLNAPVVLFGRKNSVYRRFGLDVFDVRRDARTYTGSSPVIAHSPCRGWGKLRHMSNHLPGELELAHLAVAAVRRCGGVLEHPAHSHLWPAAGLPFPGEKDSFGGFTLPILQSWFGHEAPKATWLYFVGLSPVDLPPLPFALGIPSGRVEFMSTAKREATPPALAKWLIEAVSAIGEVSAAPGESSKTILNEPDFVFSVKNGFSPVGFPTASKGQNKVAVLVPLQLSLQK